MNGIAFQYTIKEMGLKVGCFAGFCDHCLTTMSAHMHAYHYPLYESGTKIGLRMIALCRKDRVLLSKQKTTVKRCFLQR